MIQRFPVVSVDPGVSRQVLSERPELMVVSFRFDAEGAEGRIHSHPHVESTYCASGRFRFTFGDEAFEISAGDSFIIPSDAAHGCLCLEPGELIDCFAPRRDDFL